VLNTSFNVAGEPLVNTPSDAVRCYFDTGLDALILGRFVLTK
jgi:carbamoyltransferase